MLGIGSAAKAPLYPRVEAKQGARVRLRVVRPLVPVGEIQIVALNALVNPNQLACAAVINAAGLFGTR